MTAPAQTRPDQTREKCLALLGWAVQHSPWYRGHPAFAAFLARPPVSDPDFFDRWRTLPLLEKPSLRTDAAAIYSRQVPPDHGATAETTTSGSTGVPVVVRKTAMTDRAIDALTLREHHWHRRIFSLCHGFNRFLPPALRTPGGVDFPNWGPPVSDHHWTGRASAIHISSPMDEVIDWLHRTNPAYFLTQPSVGAALLDQMGSSRPPALREVRMFAEPFDPGLEQRLRTEWRVACSDVYSASETGTLAFRCPEHGQLHVQSDVVHLEVLDNAGAPCAPGQTGQVVVTALYNYATPLVRYALGDYATVAPPCPCGRPGPVLATVRGRTRNMFRTPGGQLFWPVRLGVLRHIDAIVQAQLVQVSLTDIHLNVVTRTPLTEADRAAILPRLHDALGHPYTLTIHEVDHIPRAPTGKFEECLSLI